jgi:hypothetical protein
VRGAEVNPNWQYEKIAFYIQVPTNGVCAAGTVPVYRLYNNGMTGAPNHRFTTSVAIYDQFINSFGWTGKASGSARCRRTRRIVAWPGFARG